MGKNFEGSYPQGGKSIAVDINNNLYLAGNYDNSSSGVSQYFRSEILLRKYNSSNGNQIWERKFPILDDSGTAVTTDRNGNIYISGRTQWTEDNVTSGVNGEEIIGGYSDGFLAKYNSNGDRLWTKIFGSSDGREEVTEIKSDSSNNIYITGYTTGNLEAGYKAINSDIFLIKYNSQGNQIWSRQLGSQNLMFLNHSTSTQLMKKYLV